MLHVEREHSEERSFRGWQSPLMTSRQVTMLRRGAGMRRLPAAEARL